MTIFASCSSDYDLGFQIRKWTVSPLYDESHLSADEHVSFISYIFELYGKTRDNVTALLAENANMNKSILSKVGVPFVGCVFHHFNI